MNETESESNEPEDADELERLTHGMDRLFSWITSNGCASSSCVSRRARVIFWEVGFDNKTKSWADFSRRYGDSEQLVFEIRKDFTENFGVGFAGGYASKNKGKTEPRAAHPTPPKESI
jgi:hypothetical protein